MNVFKLNRCICFDRWDEEQDPYLIIAITSSMRQKVAALRNFENLYEFMLKYF